jgi:hypothetical protein
MIIQYKGGRIKLTQKQAEILVFYVIGASDDIIDYYEYFEDDEEVDDIKGEKLRDAAIDLEMKLKGLNI